MLRRCPPAGGAVVAGETAVTTGDSDCGTTAVVAVGDGEPLVGDPCTVGI